MQLWLAALGGMILKLDHSYKVVNKVRDPSGAKQYKAVLSVMNEFCQVSCCASQQAAVMLVLMAYCVMCLL
jgi:hypothetical protein